MIQFIMITMSIIISFIFLQMTHPLAMGMTLMLQTFMICIISGMMVKTFWFSYILFLIFLGGMLVLFIYVTSLASNEMFSFSMNIFIWSYLLISMNILFFLMMDSTLINSFIENMEMISNKMTLNFLNENSINLNKLYNSPSNFLTLLLINYLLLTLFVIVKITNNFFGPLRPTSN